MCKLDHRNLFLNFIFKIVSCPPDARFTPQTPEWDLFTFLLLLGLCFKLSAKARVGFERLVRLSGLTKYSLGHNDQIYNGVQAIPVGQSECFSKAKIEVN